MGGAGRGGDRWGLGAERGVPPAVAVVRLPIAGHPTSELFLLEGARHYVQMDEPGEVARLLLTTPGALTP
jgi:pimeloyl-ACP methyl ester carboxylesterase